MSETAALWLAGIFGSALVAILGTIVAKGFEQKKNGNGNGHTPPGPRWAEDKGAVEWRIGHLEGDVAKLQAEVRELQQE